MIDLKKLLEYRNLRGSRPRTMAEKIDYLVGFLDYQKGVGMRKFEDALRKRLNHKQAILQAGGEQALSHSQEDIDRILRAISRLETKSFGLCISCGHPIAEERLFIYPEAERCIPCQNSYEAAR